MYRWLLCWRYLRTRYIALASVVSVTLGVATLIIVNSVMDGFTTEMQERMHGILSDVIVESHSSNGLPDHEAIQQRIRQVVGDDLEGMTTVVHVPAMVTIDHRGESITRQINLIGIDMDTYADVSDFSKYLLHPENQKKISFALREAGYAPGRDEFPESGWVHRRRIAAARKRMLQLQLEYEVEKQTNQYLKNLVDAVDVVGEPAAGGGANAERPPAAEGSGRGLLPTPPPEYASGSDSSASPNATADALSSNGAGSNGTSSNGTSSNGTSSNGILGPSYDAVISRPQDQAKVFDAETEQHAGIVLGISIGTTRYRDEGGNVVDYYYVQPGDDVRVTFPSAGLNPTAIHELFTVVDFYESKMSEYDATFAFVPIERLQKSRGMQDAICSIQLRLRDGADLNQARDNLRAVFPLEMMLQVNTWRDLQGALLAAVQMETTILNILLFLIIAVAGFGILATFFMIVVEKTKDIGILKSLGAGGTGVASIFLGYGVLLGAFGAGVGAIAGLVFVANINAVADLLETITGQEVFDPTVYYFDTIPTIVHPWTVVWVVLGAVFIAVMASVLPSIRAARMHPVEALRYE
jgi:lipoprotein-releasing system permease protein